MNPTRFRAWDSIADVLGVCAGLVELGVDSIGAGPVGAGSGSMRTAHDEIPLPVPAVLELARGWQLVPGGAGELATPAGMALVTTLAHPVSASPVHRGGSGGRGRFTRRPRAAERGAAHRG